MLIYAQKVNLCIQEIIYLMMSPSRTRRLCRTTLFIRIFSSETVSSERTIQTYDTNEYN